MANPWIKMRTRDDADCRPSLFFKKCRQNATGRRQAFLCLLIGERGGGFHFVGRALRLPAERRAAAPLSRGFGAGPTPSTPSSVRAKRTRAMKRKGLPSGGLQQLGRRAFPARLLARRSARM
jgi:hypothetical protein